MAAERIARGPGVPGCERGDRFGGVADQEQVEIAVTVVVEEGSLRGVPCVGDAVDRRHLAKHRHAVLQALIDVERVRARRTWFLAGVTDVDIEFSIAVDVCQGYARSPTTTFGDPGVLRDVPEPEAAQVQIQSWAALVRGEDDLRQSVPREIAQSHAAAVVEVAIGKDVQVAGRGEAILESDARVARRQ